ncbi:phytoene synthase [cyanobacterium endosymbiont of Rhopalodia gibberula]|uniref:15-cis-phytoene synthase CrtB n=1 Tax=cyanobacterium endosymbiont of Rhopalodia gibberula TaxID=1763363 RepID=UPI000DC6FA7A|nr:phytoene synthase [cyanobacterium endosymbiont of Rhopalodia gibberula]BBA79225.1 phytoene synthase [cyanobacterium endosymbiont of Rhopalodia gibberula]
MLQLPEPSQIKKKLVSLTESYELCRQITAKFSKTFYLGTLLMPPEKRQAIWAIYVWCRRTDELVDGPQAQLTTVETLQLWEKHLKMIFSGHPFDNEDVALVDTLRRFPIEIEPFQEMIAGQQMDLYHSRYETFEELQLYCYRVAGTVGLMSSSVLGVNGDKYSVPWQENQNRYIPRDEAIALGIANQLTNILRDVGEDAQRGRIYLPLEDLEKFNYSQEDLLEGVIDERWCSLMRFEIERARQYYRDAERGIRFLCRDSRWPVWAALMLYKSILTVIEANKYDVFTKRAFVRIPRKILYLPVAWLRAQVL